MNSIDDIPPPGAEGEDQGVGSESDYNFNNEYIGPESKPVQDENGKPLKKDSVITRDKPIGTPKEDTQKKKGFLKRLFGKKEE